MVGPIWWRYNPLKQWNREYRYLLTVIDVQESELCVHSQSKCVTLICVTQNEHHALLKNLTKY